MKNSLILAIETSTLVGSVALRREGRLLGSLSTGIARTHSERLLPAIDSLLHLNGLEKHDLGLIAVSVGPGSFTGLRIGIGTAQGLAYSLGLPVLPVNTLRVVAAGAGPNPLPVLAVLNSRQGEVFGGLFQVTPEHVKAVSEERVCRPLAVLELVSEPTYVVGEALTRHQEKWQEVAADRIICAPEPWWWPRAEIVAWLAELDLAAGTQPLPPEAIAPHYLRPPLTTQRKRSLPLR